MQTFGYHGKKRLKYVIMEFIAPYELVEYISFSSVAGYKVTIPFKSKFSV